jgi:7,8-dihydropterin-6-yl-methyl-4-(beta-D-ribofuranosyl)aminobenzene 5'-phosphate synthase
VANVIRLASWGICLCLFGASTAATSSTANPATDKARITILYDAFGKPSELELDWGFSAYIEYGGKRILFDTGNNAEIFAHNVQAKGIDLTKLDFAVISHRHGDHTSGINHLVDMNPEVKIYAPRENFGVFGAAFPGTFYRVDPDLPPEQRYYGGQPPERIAFGSAWPDANFELVAETTEIAPGFHLIVLRGPFGVDLEVIEVSLAIDTPDGIVLIVGCSHPTIEKIVQTARETIAGKPVNLIVGGTHLLPAQDPEIERIAGSLRDDSGVQWLAAGHCTGEPGFRILQQVFGDRFLYAGLGSTLVLGQTVRSFDPAGKETRSSAMSDQERSSYRYLLATGHDAHISALGHLHPQPHHH